MTKKILLLHGPNLNLLGTREPTVYGSITLDQINEWAIAHAQSYKAELRFEQSNHEGALIDSLHAAREWADGVVFNPGAYTHTSVALADAVKAITAPVVEVHISNVFARETFRHHSYLSPVCKGILSGFGTKGYELALLFLLENK